MNGMIRKLIANFYRFSIKTYFLIFFLLSTQTVLAAVNIAGGTAVTSYSTSYSVVVQGGSSSWDTDWYIYDTGGWSYFASTSETGKTFNFSKSAGAYF